MLCKRRGPLCGLGCDHCPGNCAAPAELRRRFGPDGSHFPKSGVPVQAEIQSHKAPELIGQSRWKIQKIRWNQAIPADFCVKGDR